MADHEQLIAEFVGVVGSTPEQAQFYLEANNWDLNAAMSSFYEGPDPTATTTGARPSEKSRATVQDDDDDDYVDDDDEGLDDIIASTAQRSPSSTAEGKRKAKADSGASGRKQGGIATLRDLSKTEDSEEEDSEEDSQNYFAGGEKS
ncbi:hypothetical protein BGZ79_003644, partial [Entomortierella chlamydospora]